MQLGLKPIPGLGSCGGGGPVILVVVPILYKEPIY